MRSNSTRKKIDRFEDMPVWQESQELAVSIYKATNNFPENEKYGITSQVRRSSSSVSANIAEGFGRKSVKERINFYHIALGSLLETKNFLYLSARLELIEQQEIDELIHHIESIHAQINSILKYFKNNE
ncbi:four helix bundle protein [Candidatus Saccharibacteria bacterium]|nr:four helix bundle protein [Candidatus Saccharibacteria bacterium]